MPARARRLDSAQLRSPIAGIVVTPNLQNAAGKHLDAGATFAQVLDLNSAVLQVAVPERDAALLHTGEKAAIKLDSYPQRTWRNAVSVVGPEAQAGEGERTFTAEVPVAKCRRRSSRRNDGQGENFYRLAAGWVRAAARARALDLADSVELDWLVTHMNPHSSSRDLLLAAAALAAAAVMLVCSGCNSHPQTAGAAAAETPCRDSCDCSGLPLTPPRGPPDAKSFTTTGPLVADQQADIAAERDGRVVKIAVQIGDHVRAGQLLALLDDRALRSARDAQQGAHRRGPGAGAQTGRPSRKRDCRSAPRGRNARRQNHQRGGLGAREIQAR